MTDDRRVQIRRMAAAQLWVLSDELRRKSRRLTRDMHAMQEEIRLRRLDVANAAATTRAMAARRPSAVEVVAPRCAPKEASVLIADDDRGVRNSLSRLLKAEGLSTQGSADAPGLLAAIGGATAKAPLAIVLDYYLGMTDGLSLLQLLRENAALARVPVLIYTAVDDGTLREKARRLGAAGWFCKLTEHDEMVSMLLRLARAAA